MDDPKFETGTIVRYGDGETATMRIESVRISGGAWRYYGKQFFGDLVAYYERECKPATPEDLAAWGEE